MTRDDLLKGKYVIGKSTVVGDARRKWEDRVFVGEIKREFGEPIIVGMVADGVGSADIGSRGAQLAIDTACIELTKGWGNDIPELLERVIVAVNDRVYADNQTHETNGWTTLVIAVVFEDRVYIGNVGDSRAYWAQADGNLLQITRDHTYFNIYGGDSQAANAAAVVNAIGLKPKVQPDLGFYLQAGMSKEQAYRVGFAGLPLEPGDAIVLCSDGLIKTDDSNNRYATDNEIIDALHTEVETDKAAIKMVGHAEGRRPTDNVSAVTIQLLSAQLIEQHRSRTAQAARLRIFRRAGVALGMLIMFAVIGFLGYQLTIKPTTVTIFQTLTPVPTLTPTQAIDPGKARVDQVRGSGANVTLGEYLVPGTDLFAGTDFVQLVVGESGGNAGLIYWFGGSSGKLDFDATHMFPTLQAGALYIQPGSSQAEVHLSMGQNMLASVEGSRMIIEIKDADIWVYCFEGKCRFDPGGSADELKIDVGYKRLYRTAGSQAEAPVKMEYDEMWAWNEKCNYCMMNVAILPTPTATITPTSSPVPGIWDVLPTKAKGKSDPAPTSVPPTSIPPTSVPPTSIPPTSVPPTSVPPTSVPPTSVPPTLVPPTDVPPTPVPHPTRPKPTDIPPTDIPPTVYP